MKEKIKNIIYITSFIILFILSFIGVVHDILDPPTVDDLTVGERIRYERMIFP